MKSTRCWRSVLARSTIFAGVVDGMMMSGFADDPQRDVVEVPRRIGVLDGIDDLEPALRQCRGQKLCRAGTEL